MSKDKKLDIVFPEWDKTRMCPKEKLPNCPQCEEDELGMINEDLLICYNCGYEQTRKVMSKDKKLSKEEIEILKAKKMEKAGKLIKK